MPCVTCRITFNPVPCEHPFNDKPDMIINLTEENYGMNLYNDFKENGILEYTKIVYAGLSQECPCADCLVKGICTVEGICAKYEEYIGSYEPMLTRFEVEIEKRWKNFINGLEGGKAIPVRNISYPIIMNKYIRDIQFIEDVNNIKMGGIS